MLPAKVPPRAGYCDSKSQFPSLSREDNYSSYLNAVVKTRQNDICEMSPLLLILWSVVL